MKQKHPLVCIVALTWNAPELIKRCLDSLRTLTNYPNYKIIVVENCSTESRVKFSKNTFKNTDVVWIKENQGFGGGMNFGIKYAIDRYNPSYFLLLSNDIEFVEEDWLKKLVEIAEKDKSIAMTSSQSISPIEWRLKRFKSGKDEDVETICGAMMLMASWAFKKVGGFDVEEFYPAYGEENDWCYRARNLG